MMYIDEVVTSFSTTYVCRWENLKLSYSDTKGLPVRTHYQKHTEELNPNPCGYVSNADDAQEGLQAKPCQRCHLYCCLPFVHGYTQMKADCRRSGLDSG
jgi:hypothetical protein